MAEQSVIAKTARLAAKTLREGKKACDKAETEQREKWLDVFHQRLALEKMGIPWRTGDYVFRSGTVTEQEKGGRGIGKR